MPAIPENCPVCGEAVPRGAGACPECGADERAGWDEEAARHDGLDLPDEAFAEERPAPARRGAGRDRFWFVITVVLLAALLVTFLLG
jgi:hypothetical protein